MSGGQSTTAVAPTVNPPPRLILTKDHGTFLMDYYEDYANARTITDRNKVRDLATSALLKKFTVKKKLHRDSAKDVSTQFQNYVYTLMLIYFTGRRISPLRACKTEEC